MPKWYWNSGPVVYLFESSNNSCWYECESLKIEQRWSHLVDEAVQVLSLLYLSGHKVVSTNMLYTMYWVHSQGVWLITCVCSIQSTANSPLIHLIRHSGREKRALNHSMTSLTYLTGTWAAICDNMNFIVLSKNIIEHMASCQKAATVISQRENVCVNRCKMEDGYLQYSTVLDKGSSPEP